MRFATQKHEVCDKKAARGAGVGQRGAYAENFVVDEGCECEVVEYFSAVAPHVDGAELAQALLVKAVHLRDLPALVVAPDERDAVGVADLQRCQMLSVLLLRVERIVARGLVGAAHLQCQQQQKRFYRIKPAVHEVAHEEVIGVRTLAADFEKLQQVKKLAVNVAANGDGAVHALHVALLNQNLARLGAQQLHLALFDVLASLELLDPFVHVGGAAHGAQAMERTL